MKKWKCEVFKDYELSTETVSKKLDVTKKYIQRLCREDKLDCRKLPYTQGNPSGNWVIKKASVREYESTD